MGTLLQDITGLIIVIGFMLIIWAGLTKETVQDKIEYLMELFKGEKDE